MEGVMARLRRGAVTFFARPATILAFLLPAAGALQAQADLTPPDAPHRGTVGVFLGMTSSREVWDGSVVSDRLRGVALGVFVDAQTPLRLLSIRAGAGYAGRGSIVWDGDQDPARRSEARVRSHYLSLPVHGKLEVEVGPLFGYLLAGPTVDFLLASQCSEEFCQMVLEEKGTVINAAVGGGVGFALPGGVELSFDILHTEGLSEAYLGTEGSGRNRSLELLARVGRPL
jgi:hypothetical protein